MSLSQLNALVDFLEAHPELALGRFSRCKEGRSLSKRLWEDCARVLNAVEIDGVHKSGEQWRIFYNEYKYRLCRKIKQDKAEKNATGGGPSKGISLTPLQERLYCILGRDMGEPLPGVRHNPLIQNVSESEGGSGPSTSAHAVFTFEYEIKDEQQQSSPARIDENLINRELPTASSEAGGSSQVAAVQNEESPAARPTRNVQRRRRRRRQPPIESEDMGLNRAEERLLALESISAEATREHAQATNRLAAALEALGERLKEPFRITFEAPQHLTGSRKRRRSS